MVLKAFLTSIFFLSSLSFAHAQLRNEIIQDYDVVGSFRSKSYHDFGSKLTAELFEEVSKSNKLFESMNLDVDIEFAPSLRGISRVSRAVNVDNPEVPGLSLSEEDIGWYRITNSIYTGIEIEKTHGLWRPHTRGGVLFSVSSKKLPSFSTRDLDPKSDDSYKDICERTRETFNPILNKERFSLLKSMDCTPVVKKGFEHLPDDQKEYEYENTYYEQLLKWINYPIRYTLNEYFMDNAENRMFAEQLVEPFTNYSRFGFPVTLDAFFDASGLLVKGDSVQHTAFLGINPFRFLDFFSFSINNSRAAKDIRIRKEGNNEVTIQVTEYLAVGDDLELFQIRPRILFFLKYRFGQSRLENFKTITHKRTYRANLSIDTHYAFVKKILDDAYFIDLGLVSEKLEKSGWIAKQFGKLPIFPDADDWKEIEIPDGVLAKDPISIDGEYENYRFFLRFPGFFNIDRTSSERQQLAEIGDHTKQAEAEKKLSDKSFWKILPMIFGKTDRSTTCDLNAKTYANCDANTLSLEDKKLCEKQLVLGGKLSDKVALNLDCYHSEAYPEEDWPMQAWDTAQMLTDGRADNEFRQRMAELDLRTAGEMSFVSKLSFNFEHINAILEKATYERVAYELAEIFMGPETRQKWEDVGYRKLIHVLRQYEDSYYPVYLDRYTPEKCDKTDGIINPQMGFSDMHLYYVDGNMRGDFCVTLVTKVIDRLAKNISKIRTKDNVLKRLEQMTKSYYSEDVTFAIAVLMQRLSDETEDNPVRYTYGVDGSNLLEQIRYTNGEAYEVTHASIADDIVDAEYFEDTRERLTNGLLLRKRGQKNAQKLRLDLFATHRFPESSRLEIEIKEFWPIIKNEDRSKVQKILPRTKLSKKYRIPLKGVKDLDRVINGANFVYENITVELPDNLDHDEQNVMYLRVLNPNGDWLSEEQVFQFDMMKGL
ncbi:MAG: hypothetical protein VX642_05565 [Bdellovibrionota bacterium]|nr:hypothetical protein [Bdellovibrionota bacterium]